MRQSNCHEFKASLVCSVRHCLKNPKISSGVIAVVAEYLLHTQKLRFDPQACIIVEV